MSREYVDISWSEIAMAIVIITILIFLLRL